MDRCLKEAEIAILQTEIKSLFTITKKNKSDIIELNKTYELMRELTTSVSVLAEQMRRNTDDINEVKKDVEVIKNKPGDSFEHYKKLIVGGLITTTIGAIIGALLTSILM